MWNAYDGIRKNIKKILEIFSHNHNFKWYNTNHLTKKKNDIQKWKNINQNRHLKSKEDDII